jgi:hypothetical protein
MEEPKPRFGYIAFFGDRQHELYAHSALAAQDAAIVFFKPPKSKRHMVHVHLCEKDGEQVVHSTAGL